MSHGRWLAGIPGDAGAGVGCSSEAQSHAGLTLIADLHHQSHLLLITDTCTDASEDLLLWRDDRDRS